MASEVGRRGCARGVIAALLFLCAASLPARAATPGGVSGPTLWFTGASFSSGTWTDLVGSFVTTQPASVGTSTPTAIALDANFNPGVSFSGTQQWLRGTANKAILGGANTYIFAVARWNGTTTPYIAGVIEGYPSGTGVFGEGIGFTASQGDYYLTDAAYNSQYDTFSVPASGSSAAYVVVDAQYPAANLLGAIASANALSSAGGSSAAVTSGTQFELGGRTASGQTSWLFAGSIDEVILYDSLSTALTSTQISEIRSYLAIKYGITLGYNVSSASSTGTNYLSSAGTTIWSGASNATYQNDVTGIARDDSAGLDQRVSESANPSALGLVIANGTSVSTTSQSSNTAFSSNLTAVVWGDNGGSTSLSTQSGVYQMSRVWRAQTTGTGSSSLAVQVPASALSGVANPEIIVSTSSTNLRSGTATALSCGSTSCTATIPTFPAGTPEYFTFGSITSTPAGLSAQVDESSATLIWTAVSGATYNVYRGTSSGGETLLASVAAISSSSTFPVYHDLTASNGTTYYYEVTAVVNGTEGSRSTEVTAALPSFTGFTALALQLVASAAAVGSYSSDAAYVSAGTTSSTSTNSIDTSSAINTAAPAAVYGNRRYASSFYYTLTGLAPNTSYIVRLHAAETRFGSTSTCTNNNCTGSRVFNVTINGAAALTNFDVWSQAGGTNIAIGRDFTATANSSGQIYVAFCSTASISIPTTCTAPAAGASSAIIDGLQVFSAPPAVTLTLTASTTTPSPGSIVTYTTTFVNGGSAPSSNLVITTPIPSPTCFQIGSPAFTPGSTGLTATVSYSNDNGSTYTYTPVSGACGTVSSGYDAAVTNVRWTFSGTLSAASGGASVSLEVRVP